MTSSRFVALDTTQQQATSRLVLLDERQRYTIPEGSDLLRQSRAKTYCDIKSGKLRVIKDGSRTYIPGSEIIRLSTLPVATA